MPQWFSFLTKLKTSLRDFLKGELWKKAGNSSGASYTVAERWRMSEYRPLDKAVYGRLDLAIQNSNQSEGAAKHAVV